MYFRPTMRAEWIVVSLNHHGMMSIGVDSALLPLCVPNKLSGRGEKVIAKQLSLAFLTTGLAYGGAETQLVRLARQLSTRGWVVRIVSMLPPQAYLDELVASGIPVVSLGMRRGVPDPRALVRLANILKRERPLVLTTFMYHANILGRVGGRLSGVPVVISSIRNENFGGPMRDRIMRLTDCLADITTINSQFAGNEVVRRGVVPPGKLRVIPNGIDTSQFTWSPTLRARVRGAEGVDSSTFLWLAVGRLEEQKDYPNLLVAFSRVLKHRPDGLLHVVGQGQLRESLEATVRRLGLGKRVRFLGLRTDIPALLAAADALVLSSAWEGMPNVVMEAMAAGKPVVATRVGGVPELIVDGKNGFMVPPKDPEALAGAMLRLMDLPEETRELMGQAGRKHVVAQYSLDRVVEQWEALFRELLERKGVKV